MYGTIPNAKIPIVEKPPPEKIFKKLIKLFCPILL